MPRLPFWACGYEFARNDHASPRKPLAIRILLRYTSRDSHMVSRTRMDATSRRVLACGLLLAALLLPATLAGFVEPAHRHDLPDFDKRQEPGAKPKVVPPGKLAATAKLKQRIPDVRVEQDNLLQAPKYIGSTSGFLTGPNGEGGGVAAGRKAVLAAQDPHHPIKAFLDEHSQLFGHGAEALGKARVKRDFVASNNGLRTVVWEQTVDDLAVYEGVLVGHVTSQGELVNLASQFIADPERSADAGTPNREAALVNPLISAAQAVFIAAESIGENVPLNAIQPLTPKPSGKEQRQEFKAGRLPGGTAARLVWLPVDAETLRLCWEIELTRRLYNERYRVLVDVQTGDVQLRRRLTVYLSDASFGIFSGDSPSPFSPGWPFPNTNQPPLVARSVVTLSALNTNASPIGWISDGENETRGNNVDAHLDRNGDDLADLPRPQGSPFRVFNPPVDLTLGPTNYSEAATVQLFYWGNWVHDRLYELGFTEAAGNFQKDNFGRGGLGNDAVQADAQDGSGFNNANFTPTPDGVPGRIQMFLWDAPEPDRDGDFDNEVIIHEYVHGLSTRLVGGGVGIGTLQAAGMGEGWSDFYALSLLSAPSDDVDGAYPFGAYVSFALEGFLDNYYFGIRRYPYSTDLNKNPLTFKDIDSAQIDPHFGVPISPLFGFNPLIASEVHAQGEVWCSLLWEARARIIRKHGYSVGNQLMLQIVTDGMKLSPPNPTFIQARDAIILADQVNNQGANYGDLWAAFAKRGLGFSAVGPDTATTVGIVEAYDLPDSLFLSNPSSFVSGGPAGGPFSPVCQTYPLTNISETTISWTARNSSGWLAVSPTSGTLAPGASTNVLVCVNQTASVLPLGTFDDVIVFSNTVTGISQSRSAEIRVMTFTAMPFLETFESGELENYWSVSGVGPFAPLVTTLNGPHSGDYHLTLSSTGASRARNEVTLGIDLAGFTNVVLRFWSKNFGDEPDGPPPSPFLVGADFDGVAVSEDGFTWYEIQGLRAVPATYGEFVVDLDAAISAHQIGYNSTFRIRFNQVDDFQVPFDGLGIDDISITGTPFRRLTVSVPPQTTEGAGRLAGQGVLKAGAPVQTAVTATLTSGDTAKVQVPAQVTIPAGSDQAVFDLTVLDDALLDGTTPVTISANAPGFFGANDVINVADNETATLTVRLPPKAREGDSRMPRQGTVRTSAKPSRDVLVKLISSDTAELRVPPAVTIPQGQHAAEFDLTVVDDDRIDGTRSVSVTAHVDNWKEGADSMQVLDNDEPALFVQLPPSASEGNGILSNVALVRLSGRLPTNLVVNLTSGDTTELQVPATVVVSAGQLESTFNLIVMDDPLVDGRQPVTVTARAAKFQDGASVITIFDDETPPASFQPRPNDRATNVPVSVSLAWNPGIGDIMVNGGFETGDFTGWQFINSGFGGWTINDGKIDPDGPDLALPPLTGKFSAFTTQIGGGTHFLYQDILIPPDALSATLHWSDRIRNHTPAFLPGQEFRVEIRDTNNIVLAVAHQTLPGDPLLNDWQHRTYDLTRFRGRPLRIAFFEQDSIGYFNVHLDDVSVRLGAPATPTTFDVYFGTTATPGAAEFLGSTSNAFWELPRLALDTRYFWQIVSHRGPAVTRGPLWQFTTRGIGPVHHFEWGRIPSPQFVGQRFPVTLTARDDINNAVKDFKGAVTLTGLAGSGTASTVLITEIDVNTTDRVEFQNVTSTPVDLSGWTLTVYDALSWPAPQVTTTVPPGTVCQPGQIFTLTEGTDLPGLFPNLVAGTNITWNNAPVGNPIAVLLRDAGGNVVDFACVGNASPPLITAPMSIPADEWSGLPASPVAPLGTLTLQRIGGSDHNDASDWEIAPTTFASQNPFLTLPHAARPGIGVSPAVLTNFVTGVWAGFLTVTEAAPRLTLRAEDESGKSGIANEIAVGMLNNIGVTVMDLPDLVILGDELTYRVFVTNSGPTKVSGLVVTNRLPEAATFLSLETFSGACTNLDRLVICDLNSLSAQDTARITITARTTLPGLMTNIASVSQPPTDAFPADNRAFALTTVTGPLISTTNATVTEGNSTSTVARIPVRLSAPCVLPVTVDYASSNFTAEPFVDFTPVAGTLVFPPGTTNLSIDVPITGDRLDEGVDTFFVNLFSPTNGTLLLAQSRVRITDDDPTPSLLIEDVSVTEGPPGTTTSAVFRLRLTAPSGITASATYTTTNRTAAAPNDYLSSFGTVIFPAGVTSQTITVTVKGDATFEPTETFALVLSSPLSAVLGRSQAIATIVDDDDDELDHFVWSTIPSPQTVDVPFAATLTARDGLDRVATNFSGTATLRGIADSREVVIGSATNLWDFPLATSFHDARTQTIYLPEEIGGPGKINALALQVDLAPGQPLTNWTIRIKHSPLRNYVQAAWESDGWTVAYQNDEPAESTGWITFLFPEPFDYDGTNSLLVDFSFDNSTYSANGLTRYTPTETRRSVFFQTDSAFGDPLRWAGIVPPPSMLARAPNVRFLMELPVTILPAGPVQLVQGVWAGEVTVRQPGPSIFLRASDSAGHIANGNLFSVLPALPPTAGGLDDDADGDGLSNRLELAAGTDPLDSSSVTRILAVEVHSAGMVIRFTSVAGKFYRVERAHDLASGVWEPITDRILGNGGSLEVTDTSRSDLRSGFYRVVLVR